MYCGQQSFGEIGEMQVKVSNKMNLRTVAQPISMCHCWEPRLLKASGYDDIEMIIKASSFISSYSIGSCLIGLIFGV